MTALEDFSERAVLLSVLISVSKEVVHGHLSEMRDPKKTPKQKKRRIRSPPPVIVSCFFGLAVFFLLKFVVLKEVTAVNFDRIQSQLTSKLQRPYDNVVTGEETQHFYKFFFVFFLILVLLVHSSQPV